jgi:thiamine biosynthesis lipoprotein
LFLCSLLSAKERIEALEPHMGTMFRIVLYSDHSEQAHSAIRAAFDRVAQLDRELSDYKPDSELNRVCREAVGQDTGISDDLYFVLRTAQLLAERTNGAFDISIGPVVRLWRTARQTKQMPDPSALSAAMQLVGYRHIHLGERILRLDMQGMQLDLGAIAKGYAADEALRLLRGFGFAQALVAASGDISVGDSPPQKSGWEIGADSFKAPKDHFTRTLTLHNQSVSTSGDTEQYVEIEGVRYSHIVDPKTGIGLRHRSSVTVIANKGIDSDSLATAASVIAEQQGTSMALALIESFGAKGVVTAERDGRVTESETKGRLP